MIFVLVYFRALKRKPVICKSDKAFRFSCFVLPSRLRNKSAFDLHEREDQVNFEMAYCRGRQNVLR